MLKRKDALITLSTMLLALPLAAAAQSEARLVDEYKSFAGSDANAKSLVEGLRDAKEVTLTNGTSTTTFTPPTRKMGDGNVNIALALTEAKLKEQGITNPTPDQLKSTLSDILQQRASGKGWGEIANGMGMKLGDVMRAEKAQRVARDEQHERHERGERPERAEKPERPERPDKPERGR
jgi:hypothetical protein